MAIDASIYGQIQAPKETNLLAQYGQMQQIQNAQNQNRLADLAYGQQEQSIANEKAMNQAYAGAVGADGKIDRNMLYSSLAQGGFGSKLPAIQEGFAKADKSSGEVDAQKFKLANDRYKIYQSSLGALSQEPNLTKEMVMQSGQSLVDQGILPAEMLSQSVARLSDDPEQLRAMLTQGLKTQLTPEQMFTVFGAKPTQVDTGQTISFRDTNPNSPTFGQAIGGAPVQKMQSPESIASNALTRRGQNLTDARGRDFNATKVEENLIKREAQDSASNLTKASQVASFDTMLGTLDRLGAHPGLSRSVGIVGALPTRPGSESANFQAELNTFQSQAFLPMVAQLKGMGALSDAEGKKLTAAVGALDPKMGEVAFRASVDRITADMQAARNRMIGIPKTGSVRDGYRFKGGNPADQNSWERM